MPQLCDGFEVRTSEASAVMLSAHDAAGSPHRLMLNKWKYWVPLDVNSRVPLTALGLKHKGGKM